MIIISATKASTKNYTSSAALANSFCSLLLNKGEMWPQKGAHCLLCRCREHLETYRPAGQKSQEQCSKERDTEQLCHGVPSPPGGREAISRQPSPPHTTKRCPVLRQDKQGWALWPRNKGQRSSWAMWTTASLCASAV